MNRLGTRSKGAIDLASGASGKRGLRGEPTDRVEHSQHRGRQAPIVGRSHQLLGSHQLGDAVVALRHGGCGLGGQYQWRVWQ